MLCVVCYVLYIVQHVFISVVLITFLETVLCTMCYGLYAISYVILELYVIPWFEVHFDMCYVLRVVSYVLCIVGKVCISLVLSTFLEMCLGLESFLKMELLILHRFYNAFCASQGGHR